MNHLITHEFYMQDDVVYLAKKILGKCLFTRMNDTVTGGIINETEAYAGINDKASHAYNNHRTKRTETMFMEGGIAYIYLCYGIHHLFNIVTNNENIPHAILIRSIIPTHGIEVMKQRTGYKDIKNNSLDGPGKVTKALNIKIGHDKTPLTGNQIWLEDGKRNIPEKEIKATKRIGIDYAGNDALLPYRFILSPKHCSGFS